MAFALQSEIDAANQALDRLSCKNITLAGTTTNEHIVTLRHFYQTRNALFRSYDWTFLTDRTELYPIKTLILDSAPTSAWSVGDTITGITSGTTAQILTVTSNTEYEIIYATGNFTDGETITNGDVEKVYWEGIEVEYEGQTVYWWDDSDAYQSDCNLSDSSLTPDFEWTYQYYLPSDFSRLIDVYEDDGTDYEDERWIREGNRILTDYSTVHIRYIKILADPSEWDPLFLEVFILTLALKLIAPLAGTKSSALKAEIKDELKLAFSNAKVIISQENNQTGRSDWNLARSK